VPARAAIDSPLAREGRIFLFGIITASGELRELRSVRPHQSGSQIALDALAQWQFEPAELNGQPVATKVLFGLSIINSATSDLVK